MYEELVCTVCMGKLRKEGDELVCINDEIRYEIWEGIPIMWRGEFDDDVKAKEMMQKDIKAAASFINPTEAKRKLWDIGPEQYFQRSQLKSYEARKNFERIFRPLHGMLPDIGESKVLNIGCGGGTDASWLIEQGVKELVCSDISSDFIKVSKQRFAASKIKPRYYFQANAEFLPCADNSFDIIFLTSTLHHIPRPFMFLQKAVRIAPIIITCGEPSDMRMFKSLLRIIGWNSEYGDLQTHRFNVRKLGEFMREIGYEVQIKTDFVWFPVRLAQRFVNNKFLVDGYYALLSLANFLFGYWGHNFTMVASRRDQKRRGFRG